MEQGLIGANTTIATTVHDLQLLNEELPETDHDFRVDLVVTPTEVVRTRSGVGRTRSGGRPVGLLWDHLDAEMRAAIPVLRARGRGSRQ